MFKHVFKEDYNRIYSYSFVQIRGSIPFFWKQDGVKARITLSRSLDSSIDAFSKHFESLFKDYNNSSIVVVNLLNQQTKDEDILTQGYNKLISDTKERFEEQGQKIDYEYFDYHANCKKGSTSLLDE